MGAYGQRKVPYANWNRGKQQANLNADQPDDENPDWGVRAAVRVKRSTIFASRLTFDRFRPWRLGTEISWFR